eukprot:5261523-Amphidinium_carterae.1
MTSRDTFNSETSFLKCSGTRLRGGRLVLGFILLGSPTLWMQRPWWQAERASGGKNGSYESQL